jgi:ABC-type microcin C transport system permease subunit YejB
MVVFSIRNVGGVALFLAGSTWLWVTPAFATKGVDTSGLLWSVTRVLSLVTMAGFVVATVGLFARQSWWEDVVLASAGLGLVTLAPYWAAGVRGGETTGTVAWNATVHVIMVAGVFVFLLVPSIEGWVQRHVMSG